MTHIARAPQQDRGIRRVTRLLDAAAEEILLTGVDGLTMNAVAKRATTAAGSLYQFFPARPALLASLADRYETELATLSVEVAARLVARPHQTIEAAAIAFLRPFIAWYAANPAYLVLIGAMPRALPPDRLSDTSVAAALSRSLRPYVSGGALPRLDTAARLLVEIGHAAIGAAPTTGGAEHDLWMAETERLVSAYARSLAFDS